MSNTSINGLDTSAGVRPHFRAAWTQGAEALPEADTFADAIDGFGALDPRTTIVFLMDNAGEAGKTRCMTCGVNLRTERISVWWFLPSASEVIGGQHRSCHSVNPAFVAN